MSDTLTHPVTADACSGAESGADGNAVPAAAPAPEALYGALADPTRRAIFKLLQSGPRAVKVIAADLPVSQPAVSQHLKVLKAAGLVTETRDGRNRLYAADPAALDQLSMQLAQLRDDVLAARGRVSPERLDDFDRVDRAMAEWATAWPEQDALSMGLVLRIRLIARHLEALSARVAAQFDLNGAQVSLLGVLDRLPPPHESTLAELSRGSFMPVPTAAYQLDSVEKRGLIAVRARVGDLGGGSGVDGGGDLIRLTPRGQQLLHDMLSSLRSIKYAGLNRLPREDRLRLVTYLRPWLRSLRDALDT